MKYVLLYFLFALPLHIQAQKKCSVTVEIDEFTKEKIVKTNYITLSTPLSNRGGGSTSTKVLFTEKEGFTIATFRVRVLNVCSVDEDEVLYVKFMDESVIELKTLNYCLTKTEYSLMSDSPDNILYLQFWIKERDLKLLSEKQIKKCRVLTSNGDVLIETNNRLSKSLMMCAGSFKDRISQ